MLNQLIVSDNKAMIETEYIYRLIFLCHSNANKGIT